MNLPQRSRRDFLSDVTVGTGLLLTSCSRSGGTGEAAKTGDVAGTAGLIISVGSAALFLWHEMTEKDKARNRFQKKKDLLEDRKRWNRDINDVRRPLAIAYAEIETAGEKEKRRVEINTKKYQALQRRHPRVG